MTFLRALTLATHCVCVGRLGQINIYSWFILWHQLTLNKRVAPWLRLFEDSYLWSLWNTLTNTSRVVLAHIEVRLWHVWWTTTVRRKVKEFHWRAIATCWDVIHIIIYMGEPTEATEIAWEQNSQELIGTHTSSVRTWYMVQGKQFCQQKVVSASCKHYQIGNFASQYPLYEDGSTLAHAVPKPGMTSLRSK